MTTNLERICRMTTDQLAEYLSVRSRCHFCTLRTSNYHQACEVTCKDGIKQWLEQESED